MCRTGRLGSGLPLVLKIMGKRGMEAYYVGIFVKVRSPCWKQNKSGQAKDLIVIVRSGGGALQRDTALNCWGSWEATQVQPQRPTMELVPPSSLLSRARGDKGRLRHSLTFLFPSTPSPVHSCPGSAFSFNLYHRQPETKASYGWNIYWII